MFNFMYLSADILLIILNVFLIQRMHFENIAWPIIAFAIPASAYLAIIDFALYYHWFAAWETPYLFSTRILVYKGVIITGLFLSLVRPPIVQLTIKIREKVTEKERLGGK
jgi:hypothetical protein